MNECNWMDKVCDLATQLQALENTVELGDEFIVSAIFLQVLFGKKFAEIRDAVDVLFSKAPADYRKRLKIRAGSDCELWKELSVGGDILVLRDTEARPNENLLIQRWKIEKNVYYYAKFCSTPAFKVLRRDDFPYNPNEDNFIAFIFDPNPNGNSPYCPGVEESVPLAFQALGWIRRFAIHTR